MSETKFTPGPWQFVPSSDWCPWLGAIEIVGPEGKSIAWTTSGSNERHDAPMLAAAPDLFHELLTSPCPHPIGDDYSVDDCLKSGNCGCGSGAAIRKARGELS